MVISLSLTLSADRKPHPVLGCQGYEATPPRQAVPRPDCCLPVSLATHPGAPVSCLHVRQKPPLFYPLASSAAATPPSRLLTPVRRHMLSPAHCLEAWPEDSPLPSHPSPPTPSTSPHPPDSLHLVFWFSQLEQGVLHVHVAKLGLKSLNL